MGVTVKKILEVRGDQANDILSMLKCVATADGTLELHEVLTGPGGPSRSLISPL